MKKNYLERIRETLIRHGDLTAPEIAQIMGVRNVVVSNRISRLERQDLIFNVGSKKSQSSGHMLIVYSASADKAISFHDIDVPRVILSGFIPPKNIQKQSWFSPIGTISL